MTRFWLGGYDAAMGGSADGIGVLAGDEGRAPTTLAYRGVAVPASSPSWLAQHPGQDVVYAALENSAAVAAFARSGESTLAPLGEPVQVGHGPCHIAVAPEGSSLVVSNYGDGRVVRLGLASDGSLVVPAADKAAALREALIGADPDAPVADGPEYPTVTGVLPVDPYAGEGDARAPHAHAAAFLPDGRVATTDLGFDLVRVWRLTANLGLELDHEVTLPRGTGPRHMVVHPSGHLHVVTEYSNEVFTLGRAREQMGDVQPGQWHVVAATIATPAAVVGSDYPAELAVSRDGQTLYTALRGSNTIAALRVRGSGEIVEPLAVVESGVDWPRHHLVYDGALLVAGQRSETVSVLDLDERTGVPREVRHTTAVPGPTHFLPIR